ncbi:MAG: acetate/propionate family kinase [Gaiellaceae bacterium]|jgi:acetate kinase|nr:acetate/propionate family kinase [Acidobacteriota bacterium]
MDARGGGGPPGRARLDLAGLNRVLVVNAGSTSLKLSVVDNDDESEDVRSVDRLPSDVDGVAHRVVHGGGSFRGPVVIDDRVEDELRRLVELAPLHNAPAVAAIDAVRRSLPDVPHVAVFDTAFHATIPALAATYALPRKLREERGIRRYGFHGLSIQWAAERVPVDRLVVCHLGGGCSVTAVLRGKSVDTTMGFTPLEGVPMATRSGSVDPGAVLHLARNGMSAEALERVLEHESGLAGLSGTSGDVRELERSAADDDDARLALDVYTYRIASAVAGMTVPLGGLDALVFTAGVGEHSSFVRGRVCARLAHLGVVVDDTLNSGAEPDADVQEAGSRARVVLVHAREDVVAARAARTLLD